MLLLRGLVLAVRCRLNAAAPATLKKIYSAASLPDAHLIRNLLGEAGIEAHVLNENAQGGVGQLPVMEAYPQIWIVDEREMSRAREIIQAFEHMPSIRSTVRCQQCAEDNPSNFQVCWNCGANLG